jgi:FkbM family methyltransferase
VTPRGIARAVARWLPRGLPLPIVRGPLRGARWITGAAAGAGGGASIFVNLCEPEQLARAASLVTETSVCFDIGANAGLYTLLWARRARRVYAFEPAPRNVAMLYRTLALNRVTNVTILPWAVSATDGVAAFAEGDNVAVGRLDDFGSQPAATVTLDTFVATFRVVPTVIKIDVEGAEADVLRGAATVLAKHRPALLLSTHSRALTRTCLTALHAIGYRCEALTRDETEWACV